MEKYSEVSYRDIQARAKELGIAANKKREVLIEAILEAEVAAAQTESVEAEPVVEIETVVESVVEVVVEPVVESSVEPAIETVVEVVEAPVAMEPESESAEVIQAEENVLDLSLEYFDSYPECPEDEEEEEFHECDAGELIDAFEGMQLRGIPNPTGTKTVFDAVEESSAEAPKIDWGINFDAENTENDCNNFTNNLPVPCGKHTIFASPDLQMGKGVHWHYEDFDSKASKTPSKVNFNSTSTTAAATPSTGMKTLGGTVTPGKNMSQEDRVQFWLAKGPKTPIR